MVESREGMFRFCSRFSNMSRIFPALLAALPMPATAQSQAVGPDTWTLTARTASGSLWFLQYKDINRGGPYVTVWIKIDHTFDKTQKARISMTKVKFDCAGDTSETYSLIEYGPDGSTMYHWDSGGYSGRTENLIPGSVAEIVKRSACAETAR